jgi:large subunit ribosomal protein L13
MQARLQKTTLVQNETVTNKWFQVDADGQILGRMAAQVAMVLMGKNKVDYTPHVDTGDFVIITNVEKIVLSGTKPQTKMYDYYTYYSGGHKYVTFKEMMARRPEKVVMDAVRCMLPKNKLGRHMLTKLKVYRGSEHPHSAQQPLKMEIN